MSQTSPRREQDTGYEFSGEDNRLIGHLATRMTGLGWFLATVGAISILAAAAGALRGLAGSSLLLLAAGCFFGLTGWWTIRGGRAFRRVVSTRGDDITHLMGALAELNRFYTLNFWLAIVYLLLVGATLLGPTSASG